MRRLKIALHSAILWALSIFLVSCCKPLLSFTSETPPMVSAPAALAGVMDGRGRFREIYCELNNDHGAVLPDARPCNDALWKLEGEPPPTGKKVNIGRSGSNLKLVVIPGIFGECVIDVVSPFSDALSHLKKMGYSSEVIRVSGRSSCAHNAKQIRDALMGMDHPTGERIVLIGYSKGAPDILEALTSYPEIHKWIGAVVTVAGVVTGSPMADSVPDTFVSLLGNIPDSKCPPGDNGGIESLKRSTRQSWLSQNWSKLPPSIKYFSVTGFQPPEGISLILRSSYYKLAYIDPRNDGQVIFYDAIMPGSVLLGYVKADHWSIALPFSRLQNGMSAVIEKNAFPREILLEAVVRFVEETI